MLGDLNFRAERIHDANKTWWKDKSGRYKNRNTGELLMLIVSELAEAMEGDRKDIPDTHLPQYKMFDVELVDTYIRLLDLMGAHTRMRGISWDEILDAKQRYNAERLDHKPENRALEGGKKY